MPRASDSLGRLISQQMERGRIGVAEKEAETNRLNAETAAAQQSLQAMLGPIQAFTDIGQLGLGAFEAYEKSVDRDLAREELARKVERDEKRERHYDETWTLNKQKLSAEAHENINKHNLTVEMAQHMEDQFVSRIMSGQEPEALNEILAEQWADPQVKQTLDPRSALGPHQEPMPFNHPQSAPIPYDMRKILKKRFWTDFNKRMADPENQYDEGNADLRALYSGGRTQEKIKADAVAGMANLYTGATHPTLHTSQEVLLTLGKRLIGKKGTSSEGKEEIHPDSKTADFESAWAMAEFGGIAEDERHEGPDSLSKVRLKDHYLAVGKGAELADKHPLVANDKENKIWGWQGNKGGSPGMRKWLTEVKQQVSDRADSFHELLDEYPQPLTAAGTKLEDRLARTKVIMDFVESATSISSSGQDAGLTYFTKLLEKNGTYTSEELSERLIATAEELERVAKLASAPKLPKLGPRGAPILTKLEQTDLAEYSGHNKEELFMAAKYMKGLAKVALTEHGVAADLSKDISVKARRAIALKGKTRTILEDNLNAIESSKDWAPGIENLGVTAWGYGLTKYQVSLDDPKHARNHGRWSVTEYTDDLFRSKAKSGSTQHDEDVYAGQGQVDDYIFRGGRISPRQQIAARRMQYGRREDGTGKAIVRWRGRGKGDQDGEKMATTKLLRFGASDSIASKRLFPTNTITRATGGGQQPDISMSGKNFPTIYKADPKQDLEIIFASDANLEAVRNKYSKENRAIEISIPMIDRISQPEKYAGSKPVLEVANFEYDNSALKTFSTGTGITGLRDARRRFTQIEAGNLFSSMVQKLTFGHLAKLEAVAKRGKNSDLKMAALRRIVLRHAGWPIGVLEALQE